MGQRPFVTMNRSHDSGEIQGTLHPLLVTDDTGISSLDFCFFKGLCTSLSEFCKWHDAHVSTPQAAARPFPISAATACAVRIWLTQLASAFRQKMMKKHSIKGVAMPHWYALVSANFERIQTISQPTLKSTWSKPLWTFWASHQDCQIRLPNIGSSTNC